MEEFETQRRRDAEVTEPNGADNFTSGAVVDAALAVHRALGPGLLESVYEECLAYELGTRGLAIARQVAVDLFYREVRLDSGFRIDLLVDQRVVVEVKACERLLPIHKSQLLTYLKLSGVGLGLLINFNVERLRDGLHRVVQTPNPLRFCASAFQSSDGSPRPVAGD